MNAVALLLNVVFVSGLVLVLSYAGRLLGPKPMHPGDGAEPYETGLLPMDAASERMSVLYYRFAVLFVVFDVDLAFLLPWALNRPVLDATQLGAITLFTALVALMLAYFWRKGTLECS